MVPTFFFAWFISNYYLQNGGSYQGDIFLHLYVYLHTRPFSFDLERTLDY